MSDNPLRGVYDEESPPPELERRVQRSLAQAGALRSPRRVWLRPALAAAMLLTVFGLGHLSGRVISIEQPASPRYLLMLYEDSTYRDDRPVTEIVREYRSWADSLRRAGRLELGEKLANERVLVANPAMPDAPLVESGAVTGLFIVRASDLAAARRIALSCPHLRYGGRVVIRPIEAT